MNPFSGVTDWCFYSVWALGDASTQQNLEALFGNKVFENYNF
jgi:hypothetical protein